MPVIDVGVDRLAFRAGDAAGELVRIENAGGKAMRQEPTISRYIARSSGTR